MKIENLCVNNKKVKIENVNLDFSQKGIYIIKGLSGSGKTLLLEKVVFDDYEATFDNPNEQQLFKDNRSCLFSYCSQNIFASDLCGYDFICKGTEIDENLLIMYFDKFQLNKEILNKKISVLSGGERTKLALISCFLKDTAYLFLDEPTNNLDNQSVDTFINILNELKVTKHIIIVSHDERLNKLDIMGEYLVDTDKVTLIKNTKIKKEDTNDEVRFKNEKPHLLKPLCLVTKNIPFFISLLLILIMSASLSTYNHLYVRDNYSFEQFPTNNVVVAQCNDTFDELNQNYCNWEKIEVNDELKEKGITLNDIGDIANIEGIKSIYLYDDKYLYNIKNKILSGDNSMNIDYISCPQIMYDSLYEYVSFDYGIRNIHGRLPLDEKKEVALSKKILISQFGYSESNVDEAIGQSITIDPFGVNENFTIVGITYYDYLVVSFSENYNYGIYTFNENTFLEYGNNQIQYAQEVDATIGQISEMIIITDDNADGLVLNSLIKKYPAYNYGSNHYVEVYRSNYNGNIYKKILLVNIAVSAVAAIIVFIINRRSLIYNINVLRDFSNYYIKKRYIINLYRVLSVGVLMLIGGIILICNTVISEFSIVTNSLLGINLLLIFVTYIISLFVIRQKDILR